MVYIIDHVETDGRPQNGATVEQSAHQSGISRRIVNYNACPFGRLPAQLSN